MSKEMERLKEIEAAKEELRTKLDGELTKEEVKGIQEEARKLSDEESEIRAKMDLKTTLKAGAPLNNGKNESEEEMRAMEFVKNGKTETRAILSTGQIAKPTKADGINGLAEEIGSIVDDVKAVPLSGNGAYIVGYKKKEATAADVTDGSAIGGTGSEYDYVTINPAEWGVTDQISNQVKKMSPLNYEQEVKNSALVALRDKAEEKVMAAVMASDLLEKVVSMKLDENFLRTITLGFKSIKGKGRVKLYLNRKDLIVLGAVRGSDKKTVYDITFDEGSNMTGTIKEGGVAVPFSVSERIAAGQQLFGQPMTIEMPMWDNYTIETNEGGEYFKNNQIGIRGVQTANAGLCALHGMQLIKQAAE